MKKIETVIKKINNEQGQLMMEKTNAGWKC